MKGAMASGATSMASIRDPIPQETTSPMPCPA